MFWIGITGGLGTGKSTVARLLTEKGFTVIDADKIAHQALDQTSPVYNKIVHFFGNKILDQSGVIDRSKLAQEVFNNKSKLGQLEALVHPYVQETVSQLKAEKIKKGVSLCFYDVPLLFEKKLEDQFDAVIVVACDPELQVKRLQERNLWSIDEIKKRISAQLPLEDKIKKTKYIVWNNSDLESLKKSVEDILARLPRP